MLASSRFLKGLGPYLKPFFVQCKLYRYICLILLENHFVEVYTNEFLWMRIECHL